MISGSRNLFWILPLVVIIASPFWKPVVEKFLAPHGFHKASKGASVRDTSFVMTGVQMNRYENGETDMVLNAETVTSGRSDMDGYFFKTVDILLFDKKGQGNTQITGGEGHYDTGQEILTLVDDVAVFVRNEYELRADMLRYLIPYKTVKTAAEIYFKSNEATVRGTSMSYNLINGNYRVGGRVVCDLK